MTLTIRPARTDDLDAVYDICVRTADAGADASNLHADPRLPGHVFAAPYVIHEPAHAFVLAAADRPVGYVLAAADSRAFEVTLEADWWPALRADHPHDRPGLTDTDRTYVAFIHAPPTAYGPVYERYPSHLHIDLLPEAQGQGWGRRLVSHVEASLTDAGSTGVHLGVAAANTGAIAFYRATGFTELGGDERGHLFAKSLPPT